MKDVTMTGPLWLVNKSYPEDLAWNRATSRCGLPNPFFSLSWMENTVMKGASSTHQDEVLAEEQKTYTLSYIYIYNKSKFPAECL